MSGLTNNEIKIITGMLSDQKKEIMEDVKDTLKDFKTSLGNIEESVRMLAGLAAKAKELAEKTNLSIEGNGAIGIKTQVRQCNEDIKKLIERFDKAEKTALLEKIKEAECNGELQEKRFSRRAEDKRSKRKDAIALASILLTVISGIIIQFLISTGGATP